MNVLWEVNKRYSLSIKFDSQKNFSKKNQALKQLLYKAFKHLNFVKNEILVRVMFGGCKNPLNVVKSHFLKSTIF
nr:MAG TPA: hypothetical protein [Caudoviricetes sp.]